jgi:hypothetical protein
LNDKKSSNEVSNDLSDSSTAENSDEESDCIPTSTEGNFGDLSTRSDKIGAYSLAMRSVKILKYKSKLQKRRIACPISKKFNGRSKVASTKVRVNGKFVKASQE